MTTASATYAGNAGLDIYFRDLLRHPLLTAEEERELGRAAQAGDEAARERLVTSNLRFVVTMAKRYQEFGLPLEDLICEGNRGLIRAAEKFDPERGTRFLSYAVAWITAKIDRAIEHAPVVRRKTAHEQARVVRRAAAKLSQRLGATPTTAEIAHAFAMEETDVAAALNVHHALSLDKTFEDSTGTWLDRLENEDEVLPDEGAYDAERQETIAAVLDTLPEREAMLLRLLFGLDEAALTRGQIAERFGVTRQRIQQLESQALKRLREHSCAVHLLPFHDPLGEAAESGDADGGGGRAVPRLRLRSTPPAPARPSRRRQPVRSSSPAPAAPRPPWDTARALAGGREPGRPHTLRDYVVERIRASSIHDVAGSADVPAGEIRDYLFGVQPPSSSLQRLRRWYEQAVPRADRAVEAEPVARKVPDGEDAPRASAPPGPRRASLAGWGFVRGRERDPFGAATARRGTAGAAGGRAPASERRTRQSPDLDPEEAADRLSEIREFARTRAEHKGGRQLAAEIGIPANTFWSFLQGSRPRDPHASKILDWYETAPRDEEEAVPDGYRSVPVETLREFFQDEVARTSLRRAARAAGVGKSCLAVFLSNHTRTPHARTRRQLGVHYLRRQEEIARRTEVAAREAAPPGPRTVGDAVGGPPPDPLGPAAPSPVPAEAVPARDNVAAADPARDHPAAASSRSLPTGVHTAALPQRAAAAGPRRAEAERVRESAAEGELRRFYLGVALRTSAATVAASVSVPLPELMAFLQRGEAADALCLALQTDYTHRALIKARALEALLEDIDAAAEASTRRRILLAIARGIRRGGHHCPGWLHDMLKPAGAGTPVR